jgi:hypothetical protein
MLRSKRLDDEGVAKLKTPTKRVTLPDPELRGHYVRLHPNRPQELLAVARDPSGRGACQHRHRIKPPRLRETRHS